MESYIWIVLKYSRGLTHILLEALDSLSLLAALVSAAPGGHAAGTVLLRQPSQVPGVFPLHLTSLSESWDLVKLESFQ